MRENTLRNNDTNVHIAPPMVKRGAGIRERISPAVPDSNNNPEIAAKIDIGLNHADVVSWF